jgi:CRISPR-associated protein Csy1
MENEVKQVVDAFLLQKEVSADKNGKTLPAQYNSPMAWLDFVSINAPDVNVGVSHVAKLMHSSSKSSNVSFMAFSEDKPYLSTESLEKLIFDYAYSNAAYAAVADFLQLDCQSKLLGQWLIDQPELFEQFTHDKAQVSHWQKQVEKAFSTSQPSSHVLAKQIYFPVDQSYHLLAPLVSSSLAHRIFEKITHARNKDAACRKARDKGFYSEEIDTIFSRIAVQMATQSQHQNASNLNGKRSGRLFLLPSAPPQWQSQTKPPSKTFFNKLLAYSAVEPLEELKKLLLAMKNQQLGLNLQRKKLIIQHVNDIADIVFDTALEAHQLHPSGWSAHSNLSVHQQYWLDPYRMDENFQQARQDVDWSSDVLYDFSRWINKHILHKSLTFGAKEERLWQTILKEPLREFNAIVDVDIKNIDMRVAT